MTRPTPPFWTPDHPRSRGVYPWPELRDLAPRGSSPLARGLQVRTMTMSHSARIIPARAGFTVSIRRRSLLPQDHPRSRGVYVMRVVVCAGVVGSSPLARGLLAGATVAGGTRRIIPARAGFTGYGRSRASHAADHPRSRGVYVTRVTGNAPAEGSSPLARGLLPPPSRPYPRLRIILARAGFTPHRPATGHHARDHPRSRGVYVGSGGRGRSLGGSSPLARGLRSAGRTSRRC